jgi:hypothetical protein
MKKRAFVPAADCLESRIALSGIRFTPGGLPILTSHALSQTVSAVNRAFTIFATRGQNANEFSANLAQSLVRIPYQIRDGLQADILQYPGFVQSDIASGVAHPVKTEFANAVSDIKSFVQSEVAAGIFAFE